ncbi:hypothetical protein [Nocardioides sp.]|uniref:hypothetical protein n=1 Tax=Nocardioides sp. TaxID=35761 RepID=UPI002B8E3735|nr:hypothetical protein [Nocardioides sp.]HXH77158.1 hypothetical protein [Nocardioides sp.]
MAGGFRLELDQDAIDDLAYDAAAVELVLEAGDAVAKIARRLAPKRTGAGAASIHARASKDADGAYAEVSWDKAHEYMRFSNSHFLEPALREARLD